jgi:hypothetical protein
VRWDHDVSDSASGTSALRRKPRINDGFNRDGRSEDKIEIRRNPQGNSESLRNN